MRTKIMNTCASIAMAVLPAAGQNSLVVHTDGNDFSYPIKNIELITLGDNGISIHATDVFNYAYDGITSLTFAEGMAGDVTADGKVDVADVNAVINIILKTKTSDDYIGNADLNNDNKIDVSDVNEIINMILKSGSTEHNAAAGRMLVYNNSGNTDVFATSNIVNVTFTTVNDVTTTITLINADEASVRARITRNGDCKRYQVACYPTSEAPSADALETYIQENKKFDRKANGSVEFIDLLPETDYVLASLAYDEYNLPCEITTLNFTTDAIGQLPAAQVGDYFYRDGTWSTELKTNKTPIGIVFSTTPTEADQAQGFTHGYAIALHDAGTAAWSTQGSENESGISISSENDADLNDREGRTHTATLLATPDIHPAAVMAGAFSATPQGTSGWFIPSTGQWLDICHNLGGLDLTAVTRDSNGIPSWNKEITASCVAAINARLATAGNGNYTALNQSYYWTSSERSVASAYYIYINTQYYMSLQTYYKDNQFTVRPAIAF